MEPKRVGALVLLIAAGLAILALAAVGIGRELKADHLSTWCGQARVFLPQARVYELNAYCYPRTHADIAPLVRMGILPLIIGLCAVAGVRSDQSSGTPFDEAVRRSA